MFEPLTVTRGMVKIKSKSLLHFETVPNPVSQWCLPAKVIVETLHNLRFFILVTPTTLKQQHSENKKDWDI